MQKKKKKTPHLDFYNEFAPTGKLPYKNLHFFIEEKISCEGLCSVAKWYPKELHIEKLILISPTEKDIAELDKKGLTSAFWGSNSISPKTGEFTLLRQTIVLFMAALNEEF